VINMPNELHTHSFGGTTTFDSGHIHRYFGETSADPDRDGHIHYMTGVTTYDDGHTHNYRIPTGPAIYVNGGHYHYYRGNTSAAIIPNRHIHLLGGYTSIYRG